MWTAEKHPITPISGYVRDNKSSAVAEMVAQCRTSRIFAFERGRPIPMFDAHFFSRHNIREVSFLFILYFFLCTLCTNL